MKTEDALMETTTPRATQHCIEPLCSERYALNDMMYVCPRCGGLLDVEREADARVDGESLRAL
jgi:Zn finger protein HypA/HybF involved in hydrogenase expression